MSRIADKLQRISRALHYRFGIEQALYDKSGAHDVVVMYHNILPQARPDVNIRNLAADEFEKHLKYYKMRYDVVPLQQLFEGKANHPRLALTFDDGLVNNLRYALPVLESEKVPATFFITTSWIRGESTLWPDVLSVLLSKVDSEVHYKRERFVRTSPIHFHSEVSGQQLQHVLLDEAASDILKFIQELENKCDCHPSLEVAYEDLCRIMTGEEIKLLAQSPYASVGSHCVSHHNLLQLPFLQVKEELQDSKSYLEKVTGKEVDAIAFPFGLYTREMLDIATDIGYKHQLAVNYLHTDDKSDARVINRIGLYNDRSFVEQMHLVNGF